jgi:hypothetical protein
VLPLLIPWLILSSLNGVTSMRLALLIALVAALALTGGARPALKTEALSVLTINAR